MNNRLWIFLKYLFLLLVGGTAYICIELIYRGHSHWSMFVLGALCFVLVGLLNEVIPWEMPLWEQQAISTVIITALEAVTGLIVNVWLGLGVWDYSTMPLSFCHNQICLPFCIAWYFLSIIAITLDDYLRFRFFGEEKPHYHMTRKALCHNNYFKGEEGIMKITINNIELSNYMNIIADSNSFRNNMSIKIPGRLDWNLRKNLKAMNATLELFEEARNDIGKEFIEAGKVENDQVKEEYRQEYFSRVNELALQPNELEISALHLNDFKDLPLSMPERDFLLKMVPDEELKMEEGSDE